MSPDQGLNRLHSMIGSVGSGPDLFQPRGGQFCTPIRGQLCTPIDNLDVVADDGEDGGKTLKTATSRRRVPVHPELVKMGFLAFVEHRKKAGKHTGSRLFHGLKANKYGGLSWYPLRRLRDDFIPAEGVSLGPKQTVYSLRHNVRDALRRSKAPPEALLHITGWAQAKAVSDDYGDGGHPDFMAEHVAAISYPGLDLSFLHVSALDGAAN